MKLRIIVMILLALVLSFAHAKAEQESAQTAAGEGNRALLALSEIKNFDIPQGRILYERYCLFCHGEQGKGDGLNAFSLPVKPPDLTRTLSKKSAQSIEKIIREGGKGLGRNEAMPAFGGTLQDKHVAWLVDYLQNNLVPN